jgi:hypothetical protein
MFAVAARKPGASCPAKNAAGVLRLHLQAFELVIKRFQFLVRVGIELRRIREGGLREYGFHELVAQADIGEVERALREPLDPRRRVLDAVNRAADIGTDRLPSLRKIPLRDLHERIDDGAHRQRQRLDRRGEHVDIDRRILQRLCQLIADIGPSLCVVRRRDESFC